MSIFHLKQQLQILLTECENLRKENAELRSLLELQNKTNKNIDCFPLQNLSIKPLSTDKKITLFRSLFCGRDDVYAQRWVSKDGRSGYSPVCINTQWNPCRCKKSKRHCYICNERQYSSLTNQVIYNHLRGTHTIGIYPLLKDETCWFLAIDFDRATWQEDVKAFLKTCQNISIPVSLECSQSGNGAHIWIFFEEPIPAITARRLGCALLTQTMSEHYQLSLDSYDRLFPNQDTMPKGGFGNLIALPLQGQKRKDNKTVFLNNELKPYVDQWEYLNSLKKLSLIEVNKLTRALSKNDDIIDIRKSSLDEDGENDPWIKPLSNIEKAITVYTPLPTNIKIVLANLIYIEKINLPSNILNHLKKIAAFQNPEFYKAQSMRLSTYGKPRVISCAEDLSNYIGLPRGCLEEVLNFLQQHNIQAEISNETFCGNLININFNGNLQQEQTLAVNELCKYDIGTLAATTAFGKTVVGAWMLANRKVNTLILVHRQQLLEQWRERLLLFLNIPANEIGIIGAGKRKITNNIDVAMLQTLFHKNKVDELVTNYGHVIIDECHHISAFSFEQVMKKIKARYVLGLTATPIRKDGHHPIIMMQCGPIRYRTNTKKIMRLSHLTYVVKPQHTNFNMPYIPNTPISDIFAALIIDKDRNELIFNDVLNALEAKRSPLLLTERTQHLDYFAERLSKFVKNIVVLKGGLGKNQHKQIAEQLQITPANEERLIIATGRYIGEGFDDARLDTLFLTMPISWHGTLQQYLGRLHRHHNNKKDVLVYDYVDSQVPVLLKMYQKRFKKYQAIGYSVE